MGVPTLEFGYTSATTGMGDHEVHKGHVALAKKILRSSLWISSDRGWRSRCINWAAGSTIRGSIPSRSNRFFSFPKGPYWLWGLPSLLVQCLSGFVTAGKFVGA
jgi:hypothetical protein